jgi:8-oxo-dGTP diphosphatase
VELGSKKLISCGFNLIVYDQIQNTNIYEMTEVKFYEPQFEPGTKLTYSVISAKYKGQWIFVRHHKRSTWEIAGGHIEAGETSLEAAGRELVEETGARNFNLICIATYSVTINDETGWGRLYLAEVTTIGSIPDISEIAEREFSDQLPENLTHPEIQPHLFNKTVEFLKNRQM